MGVSGCGKTSVGEQLAQILDWPFFDGDHYHPPENIEKMASGIPLDDSDREPWLAALHNLLTDHLSINKSVLLACSALKQKYRQQLQGGNSNIFFVYLKGDFDLIFNRMQARSGHYMKSEMLVSQFAALEEPAGVVAVDIHQSVQGITEEIITKLNLK